MVSYVKIINKFKKVNYKLNKILKHNKTYYKLVIYYHVNINVMIKHLLIKISIKKFKTYIIKNLKK